MSEPYQISFGGTVDLEPRLFFADQDNPARLTATVGECADEVRRYIEAHGLAGAFSFISDWCLDDAVTVSVNGEQVWP